MSDGQIRYDFNVIGTAGDAIDAAVTSMKNTLSALEADLAPLASDAWTSEAQTAYKIRRDRWNNASEHIALVLEGLKVALADSAVRMRGADKKAASYFS